MLTLLAVLLAATGAQAATKGVTGFFGNPGSAGETIGGRFSTTPQGVAVNDATGQVYVVDSGNNRIESFDSEGNFEWAQGLDVIAPGKPGNQPQNEVQEIALLNSPTAGTFNLSYPANANNTPVPYNATAVQIKTALELLPELSGNISVTLAPGGNPGGESGIAGGPWRVAFINSLADANVVDITISSSALSPSTAKGVISILSEGAGVVEKCTVAADCKAAIPPRTGREYLGKAVPGGGFILPQGIAIDQPTGDLYVTDKLGRVQKLHADGSFVRAWGLDVARSGSEQSNEQQRLTVDATSGTYKLVFYPTGGRGKLTSGSATITQLVTTTGAFSVGQPIAGPGIPAGATITALSGETLTLSAAATSSGTNMAFSAGSPSATTPIAWDEAAAGIEAKLAALSSIGSGNVSVTDGSGSAGGTSPYLIRFEGPYSGINVASLVVEGEVPPLEGGSGAAITVLVEGGEGFEICELASNCLRGINGGASSNPGGSLPEGFAPGYLAVAPAGAPNASNIVVGDARLSRVQEFTPSGEFVRAFGQNVIASGPNDNGVEFEVCRSADLDLCRVGVAGNGVGQFSGATGSSPTIRVAIDTTGSIFTVEPGANFRLQKFTQDAGNGLVPSIFNPQIQTLPGESPAGEFPLTGASTADSPFEIVIDPSDDHLYVTKGCTAAHCPGASPSTERRIYEFSTSGAGTLVETHLAGYGVAAANGLAVRSGDRAAYLTAPSPKPGVAIVSPPTPPSVTIQPTTSVSGTCATLHGVVNPNGGNAFLHTFFRFEYRPAGSGQWSKAPVPDADAGAGTSSVPVEATVCGLQPNKHYEVRLVATKGGAPVATAGVAGEFTTDAAPPTVQTFAGVWDANSDELIVRGGLNPNNSFTTYYFQYGTEPCSGGGCLSIPEAENAPGGSGGTVQPVFKRVAGLAPEMTYHFRLLAENGVGGEVAATERTFTIPAVEANPCPNQDLRVGASARLAECRAYEWVSRGDSWGSGIGKELGAIADDGERASFQGQAFGQPRGVPGPSTPYISERTEAGWTVRQVTPPPALGEGSYTGTRFMLSADLRTVLWPQSTLGRRLRGEVRWGTVGIDGSEEWTSDWLAPVAQNNEVEVRNTTEFPVRGAVPDLSTFVFSAGAGMTYIPGETFVKNEQSNLYQVEDGQLDIVNRGGPVTPGNTLGIIGGVCGAGLGGAYPDPDLGPALGAVSSDGLVIHFTAHPGAAVPSDCSLSSAAPKRIFKRVDGLNTVEVSACGKPNPGTCGSAGDDVYRGASSDGRVTFFTTPRQLTDSDSDSTEDLYIYDESLPVGERLTQASAGEAVPEDHPVVGAGAQVQAVFDNSDDGSRVYFLARGRLTSEATKGDENLYLVERDDSHPNGRISFVAKLATGESRLRQFSHALSAGEDEDDHRLLLLTAAPVLDEDLDSALDLYFYDDERGEAICLTCVGSENLNVSVLPRDLTSSWADSEQRARAASADAASVVFTTSEDLLAEDTNGIRDAYLWHEGSLSLVSAGSEAAGVESIEASISQDGEDVLFVTRTGLVGADKNNGLDLYTARIGGGFAETSPTDPCASPEGCQGSASATPEAQSPASANFVGPGNPKQPRPCKKGRVRRQGKCIKKPAKKHHRKAEKNRSSHKRGARR